MLIALILIICVTCGECATKYLHPMADRNVDSVGKTTANNYAAIQPDQTRNMLTKENKKKLKIATNNVKEIMGNIRLKKLANEYVKKTKGNKYWPKNGAANRMMKNRMQKQGREKNGKLANEYVKKTKGNRYW